MASIHGKVTRINGMAWYRKAGVCHLSSTPSGPVWARLFSLQFFSPDLLIVSQFLPRPLVVTAGRREHRAGVGAGRHVRLN